LAWTTPKTWASGYIVLAADLNTHLRDNLNVTAPAVMTTAGDIIYASGANTPARLAKSTTSTQYLANTGSSNIPAWNEVALDTGISGTLPVGNGGTGQTSLTTGAILIGNSSSAVTMVTQTTKGQILIGDGSGPPQMLAVGSNDQVLIADSGETTGVKWGAAAGATLAENMEDFVEGGTDQVIYATSGAIQGNIGTTGTLIGGGWKFVTNASYQLAQSTTLRGALLILADGVADKYSSVVAGQDLSAADDWTIVIRALLMSADSSQPVFMGLSTADAPADANDRIGFRSLGGNIVGFTDAAGSETTRDSGTAANGSTVHTFRIEVSGNGGTVKFYLDNSQIGANVTTTIPSSTAMQITIGVTGQSGVGGTLDLANAFAWREV